MRKNHNRVRAAIRAGDGRLFPTDGRIGTEDISEVQRAYRQRDLARICTLREDRVGRAYGMETVKVAAASRWMRYQDQPEDYYHFRDNGGRVLAVAHLDTVVRGDRRTPHFRRTAHGPLIVSGALDDRLGAYTILHLLPELGITCDWLLTVGEESCSSTAEWFKPAKDYDHVIEFDRMGTDVVMYQYDTSTSRAAVKAAGAVVGHGSYSDIASMEHLGVTGLNWGVGYRGNYHSEEGFAYLHDTFAMVAKYQRFHAQNAGQPMPFDGFEYGSYGRDRDDRYFDCEWCGEKETVDSVTWYCTNCGACEDCGATNPEVAAEWNDPDVDVCQCYVPSGARRERDDDDDGEHALTWEEWLARRPAGPKDTATPRSSAEIAADLADRWNSLSHPAIDGAAFGESRPAHRPGEYPVSCPLCAAAWKTANAAEGGEAARAELIDQAAQGDAERVTLEQAREVLGLPAGGAQLMTDDGWAGYHVAALNRASRDQATCHGARCILAAQQTPGAHQHAGLPGWWVELDQVRAVAS